MDASEDAYTRNEAVPPAEQRKTEMSVQVIRLTLDDESWEHGWEHVVAMQAAEIVDLREKIRDLELQVLNLTTERDNAWLECAALAPAEAEAAL